MNTVSLMGRIVRAIELRDVNGSAVMNNTLAVANIHKGKDGVEYTNFIPIVAWGKVAERFANYVEKGHRIALTGHLRTRSYVNKQQQQVYIVEVVVEDLYFVEPKKANESTEELVAWLTQEQENEHAKEQEDQEVDPASTLTK